MHNDQAYQKANYLFKSMNKPPSRGATGNSESPYDSNEQHQLNDRVYLANYVEQIVDLFSLKDNQNYQMGRNHKIFNQHEKLGDGHCRHSLSKFVNQTNGILNDASKTDKDTSSISNTNSSAAANSNFQVFRFLWSTKSQILTIHFLQLNPYMLPIQTSSSKNFKRIMQENFDLLYETIIQPCPSAFSDNCHCHKHYNSIRDPVDNLLDPTDHSSSIDYSKRLNPPIFLKRSMKVMRKVREKDCFERGGGSSGVSQVCVNGLVHRIIPNFNQLAYDKQGEDVLITKRKSKLKVSEIHKMQLRKQIRASEFRSKRLKEIE